MAYFLTPVLARLLMLCQVAIGIFTKSNAYGFKDSDKFKIPKVQIALCTWPGYGYLLLLILPLSTSGWITGSLDFCVFLLSLVIWCAWFYKHKMTSYLVCFLLGSLAFFFIVVAYRESAWIYYLSVFAHVVFDISLLQSIMYYLGEAIKRRVLKNQTTLAVQTALELVFLYVVYGAGSTLGIVLAGIGAIECAIMWGLDYVVKEPEVPVEQEVEREADFLTGQRTGPQGIAELNEPVEKEKYEEEPANLLRASEKQ